MSRMSCDFRNVRTSSPTYRDCAASGDASSTSFLASRSSSVRTVPRLAEAVSTIVVHASVHGTGDVSTVLTYMLVSRMLERIGDNA